MTGVQTCALPICSKIKLCLFPCLVVSRTRLNLIRSGFVFNVYHDHDHDSVDYIPAAVYPAHHQHMTCTQLDSLKLEMIGCGLMAQRSHLKLCGGREYISYGKST